MLCSHEYSRRDGSVRRCKSLAVSGGVCSFHAVDWAAHYERADSEAAEYEARTGRNLFLDRLGGRVR